MITMTKDLSALTSVPTTLFDDMVVKARYIIAHAVYESIIAEEDEAVIDLGFGEIVVRRDGENVKFRFTPSEELSSLIRESVDTHTSPLIGVLEDSIKEKLEKAYKRLF